MSRALVRAAAFLCILLFAAGAAGEGFPVPHGLNVQGVLRNAAGELTSGSWSTTFRLYTASAEGTLLWEGPQTLTVTGGVFNAYLGPFDTNVFAGRSEAWLEIQVGLDSPLPRRPITSVGYAFVAERAVEADGLTGILPLNHGGTGSASKNFVDLSTGQTVGGVKVFTDGLGVGLGPAAGAGTLHVRSADAAQALIEGGGTVPASLRLKSSAASSLFQLDYDRRNVGIDGLAISRNTGVAQPMAAFREDGSITLGDPWFSAVPWVDVRANGTSPALTVYQAGSGPILRLVDGDGTGNTVVEVDGIGRVGIGTGTPAARLQVRNAAGGGTSLVSLATTPTGLGDSLLNVDNQAGRVLGVNAFGGGTNLVTDLGPNYAVSSGDGTTRYVPLGAKKAPVVRLNAEDGSVTIFGENGTGPDFRTPTSNLGVLVTGAGRVGIGISPDPAYRLDVNGPLKVRSGGIQFPDGTVQSTAAGAGAAAWAVSGLNIHNTNTGNVGIGTASPVVKLDIVGTDDRMRLVSGNAQLNLGQWDGTTHRIEGDANRDLLLTSYSTLLRLGMAGSTHLAIHSSGRVGLGTTAPMNPLHIAGGSGDGRMQFTNDATGNAYADGLWLGVDANQHYVLGRESLPLTLFTAATERVRVAADGKVGIGTTAPAYLLDVAGQIRSSSGGFVFPDGTVQATAVGATYWAGTGGSIYNTNTGNVAIGTIDAAARLTVYAGGPMMRHGVSAWSAAGPTYAWTATQGLEFAWDSDHFFVGQVDEGANRKDGVIAWGDDETDSLRFVYRGWYGGEISTREALRVLPSGNVGIGTASPGNALHVYKNQNQVANFESPNPNTWVDLTSTSHQWSIGSAAAGSAFQVYERSGSNQVRFSADAGGNVSMAVNGGNVGIGTSSPTAALHVAGTGNLLLAGQTSWGLETSESPALQVIDRTNSIRRASFTTGGDIFFGNLHNAAGANATLSIRPTGYVGIGTANPLRRLVVQNNTAQDASTALALYNVDTTDGRDLVVSFRTDTTGAGATAFTELAAVSSSALVHDAATAQSDLKFWTANAGTIAQAMRIDPQGNVGIGVVNPANPYGSGGTRLAVKGTEYVLAAGTDQVANGTAVRIAAHSPASQGLIELDWFNDSARIGGGYGMLQVGKSNWNQDLGIGAARVGIGTGTPLERLDVRGNLRTTGAIVTPQRVTHLPWFNAGDVQTGYIKLVTPIVYNVEDMFSIKIAGYKYGSGGKAVEIRCGGYAWAGDGNPPGGFIARGCYTEGTDMPVEIGTEDRAGVRKVVIRLGTPTSTAWHYDHYTAEYVGWRERNPADFLWVKGETTPVQEGNTNNVVIDDAAGSGKFSSLSLGGVPWTAWPSVHGGSGSADTVAKWTGTTTLGNSSIYDNGKVGIGTTGPQVPLHVMGTYNAPSAGSAPNGSLVLGSTSTGVQMAMGVTADVEPQYGWIQSRYMSNANTYNLVLQPYGGNVGIRTTTPTTTLQIGQGAAGDNVDYGLSVQRHGTLAAPGTYTNTSAINISDLSTDGPSSVDATGLLSVYVGRIATNDPNAGNATLFYARNDDSGGVRIDGKKNLWVGWDQSSTSTQSNSLIVQNGNVGVGTVSPMTRLQVNGDVHATGGILSGMGLKDILGNLTGTYTGTWTYNGSVTDGRTDTISQAGAAGATLEFTLDGSGQWAQNNQAILVFAGGHWWGDMGGGTWAIDIYNSNTTAWTEVGQFTAQGLYAFNNPIPYNNPPYLTKIRLRCVAVGSYGRVTELRVYGRTAYGWLKDSESARRGYFETVSVDSGVTIGGSVGIGTTSPTATLQVAGSIRAGAAGRIEYAWYENSEVKTANYLHIKTGLWGGGSPTGNTRYIMGGFHATGYNYDGRNIDSYWMFHNWSGMLYSLVIRNQGTYPYAKGAYVSTDGYVVIVADYTAASYIGAIFDLIQSYGGYPWQKFGVTATRQTDNPTGAF